MRARYHRVDESVRSRQSVWQNGWSGVLAQVRQSREVILDRRLIHLEADLAHGRQLIMRVGAVGLADQIVMFGRFGSTRL